MASTAPLLGTVATFDRERGLGTVEADGVQGAAQGASGGAAPVPFHCTAITDGTRDIAVGTRVTYLVAATHRGGREARGVTPVTPEPTVPAPGAGI